MTDTLLATLAIIDSYLWGPWTMAFLAGVAVFFTVTSGVFQLTGFRYILRSTVGCFAASADRSERQQLTPFQAAATSLAGTVGMGNMAGVATALSVGGAGAIFWMWVLAFFGMMSKTVEITLGVYYRERGAAAGHAIDGVAQHTGVGARVTALGAGDAVGGTRGARDGLPALPPLVGEAAAGGCDAEGGGGAAAHGLVDRLGGDDH